ncbi:MAG: uroporphyrinogen-III decarboxylase-like protein [Candidatus Aminicenantes bacterium]|nr:MAG: uroporphyrinogen-III decarboxylase-like protein [Candidatus Aminicenantes bacterium]
MPKETMTPKERWLAVLSRNKPDRIPMDYWATPETTAMLMKHLGCSTELEMFRKLHIDMAFKVKPEYIGPPMPRNYDVFGRGYKQIDYGIGTYDECVFHPLAPFESVSDVICHYDWPNPDWWDYRSISAQIVDKEDYPILGGHFEPFLIYKDLRGQETAFMDLVHNPELVHFCLDKLFELGFTEIQRLFEQIPGKVMLTYVAEDLGAQDDLMISPAHIREFLLPKMKQVIDFVHSQGAFVFHHNDGSIRRILPDMITAGIDILNPIQWRAENMDRKKLKADFGNDVVFHGAVDNQQTLPFGSVEEIQQEVLENISILGTGGGYILAPCHNIQPITPIENILAMYETGYKNGWT